jgi:hypothetical protein
MSLSKALEWRRSVQRPRQLFFFLTLIPAPLPWLVALLQFFLLVPLFHLLFSHFLFYSFGSPFPFPFLDGKTEGWMEASFCSFYFSFVAVSKFDQKLRQREI